jgi:hypothetical protein
MAPDESAIVQWGKSHITVVKDLPSYANDPFFVKKYEEALKFFDNAPMPDFIAKKIIKPE